jgi:hypothetical protein
MNGSPVDTLSHGQNGVGLAIPIHGEELAPALHRSPSGTASLHPDTRGQAPENTCVPLIPSQASSTMVSGAPPMTYPPPPPTAFYAPAPWFMHPYPYMPPPYIGPGYPPTPIPLTPSVVSANEAGHPVPSNSVYQVRILNYNLSQWIADFSAANSSLFGIPFTTPPTPSYQAAAR